MTLINSELIIDPRIFRQNISYIKNKIQNSSKFLAVIKSDAYGHLLENIVVGCELSGNAPSIKFTSRIPSV